MIITITITKPYSQNFKVDYGSSIDQLASTTCILFYYSILSEVTLSITSLIDIFFFTTLISDIFFFVFYIFFHPLNLYQLTSSHQSINHFSLNMTKPSILSLIFSTIGTTLIFNKFPHFKFYLSLYLDISIIIFLFQLHPFYKYITF